MGASFSELICEVESVDECTGPRMRKVVMPSISGVRMPYHLELTEFDGVVSFVLCLTA